MRQVTKDPTKRIEAVEPDVPADHDVGIGSAGDQRGRAGRTRREEVLQRPQSVYQVQKMLLAAPEQAKLSLLARISQRLGLFARKDNRA